MGKEKKYSAIANDPVTKRWHENLRRGSEVTATVAVRRLGRVCELLELDPKRLVAGAKKNPKRFQDALEDMVARLEAERKSPGYIVGLLKVVRSLLRYHDVVLTRKIKISNSGATPTIEDEQVPSQEELSRLLRSARPRIRVAMALLAFADLRPETLANFSGSDGLRLKDLPEMRVAGGEVTFARMPAMVAVRANLSKTRHKYFTFLSSEGCTYLKEYLEFRLRGGEKLAAESPLIGHERQAAAKNEFLRTQQLGDEIRECMRAAGVRKRPYVLRAYAETQLIIAESKGKISHPYLQFIAGHKGDIEARYSTNKGRLPPDMIEGMREAYKHCEPFMGTVAQPLEQASVVKEAKIEAIKTVAKNLFGVDLAEVRIAHEHELGRELNGEEEIQLYEREMLEAKRHHADELMNYLFADQEFAEMVRRKLRERAAKERIS
jgi:hypothetical protein